MDIWHKGAKLEDHKKEHDVSHPYKYRDNIDFCYTRPLQNEKFIIHRQLVNFIFMKLLVTATACFLSLNVMSQCEWFDHDEDGFIGPIRGFMR